MEADFDDPEDSCKADPVEWEVLDTQEHGVPQRRPWGNPRVFA